SRYAAIAETPIFSTLIQKLPEQKDRIRKAAKVMFAKSVAWDKYASKGNTFVTMANRGSTATHIADQLAAADLLLKDAESYARKGVDALQENIWIAEQREAYARRKQKIPPTEEFTKEFAEVRALRIGTLGRVEMKLGRTAEARKLLEESYAVTPSDAKVAAALGEMAAKAGDDAKAMDYLVPARLSGHAPDSANQPTGDTNGPDTEVMLDLEVAGAVAPGARIVVYFAPNTDAGFLDAINQAAMDKTNKPSVISISWGGPESSWTAQSLQNYNSALQAAAAVGVTVCVACGDNGSTDGSSDGSDQVDFPSSSPYSLACGGTRLDISGSAIASEVVWNDLPNGGATGGGVSATFPLPSYQANAKVPPSANSGGS